MRAGLAVALEKNLGTAIRLVVTENRRVMVSFRRSGDLLRVRLHRLFLSAPAPVLDLLARYIGRPTARDRAALRRHIARNLPARAVRPRNLTLTPAGRHFDLEEIFGRLNEDYFRSAVRARITWGQKRAAPPRRSIRFGSYNRECNLIRIHPALDRGFVPAYVVEAVVYHEMLHAVIGVLPGENGRRVVHGEEFKAREKKFRHHRRARTWRREHVGCFLHPA